MHIPCTKEDHIEPFTEGSSVRHFLPRGRWLTKAFLLQIASQLNLHHSRASSRPQRLFNFDGLEGVDPTSGYAALAHRVQPDARCSICNNWVKLHISFRDGSLSIGQRRKTFDFEMFMIQALAETLHINFKPAHFRVVRWYSQQYLQRWMSPHAVAHAMYTQCPTVLHGISRYFTLTWVWSMLFPAATASYG